MAVTIYDIAKTAGTSHTTVSRALRGNAKISVEVRRNVQRIAAELGYRPDRTARMLKSGKTHSIGVLLPDFANPFHTEFLQAVQRLCQDRGYHLFPVDYRNDEKLERQALEHMLERRCDGCIASLMRFEPLRDLLQEFWDSRIPILVAGLPEDVGNTPVDGYREDFSVGIRQAIEHLVGLGHREIIFAGSWHEDAGVAGDRFEFLQAAYRDSGLTWSHDRIARHWTGDQLADGKASARIIFDKQPNTTAILGANDLFCVGLIRGLTDMGMSIPADVSLIGTDDTWTARYWPTPLTSISQDTESQATFAVETLLGRLESHQWQPSQCMTLNSELIIRESTAAPRTG